jgi:hypothetical protein
MQFRTSRSGRWIAGIVLVALALATGCTTPPKPGVNMSPPTTRWEGNSLVFSGSATGRITFAFSGFNLVATSAGLPTDAVLRFAGKRERVVGGSASISADISTQIGNLRVSDILVQGTPFTIDMRVGAEFDGGAQVDAPVAPLQGLDVVAALARVKGNPVRFPSDGKTLRPAPANYGALLVANAGNRVNGVPDRVREVDYIVFAEEKTLLASELGPACNDPAKTKLGNIAQTTLTFYERVTARVATQVEVYGPKLCGKDAANAPVPPTLDALQSQITATLQAGIAPPREDLTPRQ